ncbi:MAG: 16S rRNA (cytosine(1402)-N(4))-methyltransferase RsmH, partial [Firmicutes bacterium]|nr:16S rRNA (cytosine(1402)-N(4))-methyltransferase RsmH [Bacillota bacterium]
FFHKSVLFDESIELLKVREDGIYLDCTVGAGGHSQGILKLLGEEGLLLGIDQDEQALQAAEQRLSQIGSNFKLFKKNFEQLDQVISSAQVSGLDGIIFDLGVSSPQLDLDERGFSYRSDASLDMRMDLNSPSTAASLLAELNEEELTKIFREYGEERWASRIAKFIVQERKELPIERADQLVDLIRRAIPAAARRKGGHPAKRTFQALRIAVNRELEVLEPALRKAIAALNPGGVLVVITFHSLEDRIVKNLFREKENPCVCPPNLAVCLCGRKKEIEILTRKPLVASEQELKDNPRAKSAKLRAVRKIEL